MQYLLMIYEAEEIWENLSEKERETVLSKHSELHQYMNQRGIEFIGQPLMPTATAVNVRTTANGLNISDGPFAETKEQLAGFYLVTVDNVEVALDLAARLPEAQMGCIEVRPIADHDEYLS